MWQVANPRIDNTYIAVAAKLDTLHDDLYHDPFFNANIPDLLYFFQFLFPALVYLLATLYIKSSYKAIMTHVKKQVKHKNWATISAYAVMCWTFVLYVIALDANAVAFRGQHIMPTSEFFTTTDDNLLYQYPLMLLAVWDTFGLHSIVMVAVLVIISRVKINDTSVLGLVKENLLGLELKDEKTYFLMILFGIAPLLCLASHAHYIAIAWITDPVYAGAIGIYYGIVIFMQFFLLKQAYAKDSFWKTVGWMSITWLTIFVLQVLITVFFVYIPVKHSIENTPTFLYAVISGSGVLLLLLIAYKVIHDPRGTLSISGTIQNILNKMERENRRLNNVNNWDDLDEEEKLSELMYKHYNIEGISAGAV